jgi:excisionase family DNA binding protein
LVTSEFGADNMPSSQPQPDPRAFGLTKATYTVRETMDQLSIGRTSLYAAIKRGDLRMMKFGDKSLFLANDLAEFLSKLEPAA